MTGDDFRDARIRLGLTQQQLGEALGLHRVQIAKIEGGIYPVKRIHELALEALEKRARRRARHKQPSA